MIATSFDFAQLAQLACPVPYISVCIKSLLLEVVETVRGHGLPSDPTGTIPTCSTRNSKVGKCAAFQLWTPTVYIVIVVQRQQCIHHSAIQTVLMTHFVLLYTAHIVASTVLHMYMENKCYNAYFMATTSGTFLLHTM